MTLRDLQKLVNDAIERGEDPDAVILDGEPEGFVYDLAYVPVLNFTFAYSEDGYWQKCNEGDRGAEPVAWFE